jgi:hypothetical protein
MAKNLYDIERKEFVESVLTVKIFAPGLRRIYGQVVSWANKLVDACPKYQETPLHDPRILVPCMEMRFYLTVACG